MNSQHARFILQSWRANGQDESDPRFNEALQALENDPELAAWFERELALDRVIASKLRSATALQTEGAPALPQILAPYASPASTAVPAPRPWLAWAAMLAILAVACTLVLPVLRRPSDAGRFRADMATYLNAGFGLELVNTDATVLQQWVAARPPFSAARVPKSVEQLPGIGCRTLVWTGRPVGLLCFSDRGQAVHLLVLSPPENFDPAGSTAPVVTESAGWKMASWTENGLVYVMARQGTESDLRRLLDSLNAAFRTRAHNFSHLLI